jgi:O-glycosyl hydrolase
MKLSVFLAAGAGALLATRSVAAQVDITVDATKTHQVMEGFGATHSALANAPAALRTQVIDAIYGQVGISTGNVSLGVWEGRNAGWTSSGPNTSNDDDDPFHFQWDSFVLTQADADADFLALAAPKGFDNAYFGQMVSLRWGNPWLEAIRSSSYATYLDECAEMAVAPYVYLRQKYGTVPRYMELFNEPTSGNTELNPGSAQEMIDIIQHVGARLQKEGFSGTSLVVPAEESEDLSYAHAEAILADAGARAFVGAIAYHTYPYGSVYSSIPNVLASSGSGAPDLTRVAIRGLLRDLGTQYGLPVWMTEVSHGYVDPMSYDAMRGRAIHIHDELVYADAAAYFGMNNACIVGVDRNCDPTTTDVEGGIAFVDPASSAVDITGMGYAIGHYARWVKRGARRIDATSSDALVLMSAFRDDARGRLIIVAVNNANETRALRIALTGATATGPITGEQSLPPSTYWQPVGAFPSATPSRVETSIPALGAMTLVVPTRAEPDSDAGTMAPGPDAGGNEPGITGGNASSPNASAGRGCRSASIDREPGGLALVAAAIAIIANARLRSRARPPRQRPQR